MRHVYRAAVRFDDYDTFDHVNNVVLVEYLQEARIDFAHTYLADATAPHEASVVAALAIDYLVPIAPREQPVEVHLWVRHIGTSSFEIGYEVRDGEASTVFARGETRLVAYDLHAGTPRPLTPGERGALEPFVEPPSGEQR